MCEAFIIRIERDLSQEEYQEFLQLVSSEKRKKIERYRRFEDAQRTLLGDVLIRLLAQKALEISNRDIVFTTNKYGKPSLAPPGQFHFN